MATVYYVTIPQEWGGVRGGGRGRRARQVLARARPPHVGGGREWCGELDVRFVSVIGCTLQGKTGRTRRISDRGCIGLGKGTGDGTYLSTVARGTCRILWATPAARS